jgi:hypothetical protein
MRSKDLRWSLIAALGVRSLQQQLVCSSYSSRDLAKFTQFTIPETEDDDRDDVDEWMDFLRSSESKYYWYSSVVGEKFFLLGVGEASDENVSIIAV